MMNLVPRYRDNVAKTIAHNGCDNNHRYCCRGVKRAGNKTRVMMLDDERFLLELYKASFVKHGYEVSTYYNAEDALRVLREGAQPDVILFDITMPDSRSGYEFIEVVQREKFAPSAIKISLTNEGQDAEIQRIAELGADGHLLKANYIPSEIVAKVAEMLLQKTSHGVS